MQWRRDGYTIDTERERLDLERIAAWLRGAYWATGRPAALVRRSWDASGLTFGLYAEPGGELAGCARVITDFTITAYLSDVFIAPEHRGRGLGTWLVETIFAHPELAGAGWLLHTRDAHEFYRRFGFTEATGRVMVRPRPAGEPMTSAGA